MNVLDLAHDLNLSPKRSASTNGGEYKSKCPKCQEGTDRFCIWPNQGVSGRYWCRVCNAKGDGIQFCRDFLGLGFHEACRKVDIVPRFNKVRRSIPNQFIPKIAIDPSSVWKQTAERFLMSSQENLINTPQIIELLLKRGLTIETIRSFRLGWNPENLFQQREAWGIPSQLKENGSPRRQWLPKGIVIPSFFSNELSKIKIRRNDWVKEDWLPKYVEIAGSSQSPSIYGNTDKPIVIVESELDAILIQQEASSLVCCLALGGVSKKPDTDFHALLKKAPLILLSLDFDDAGKKHSPFWMKLYPNLRPWPSPFAKSPGDAHQIFHLNILSWLKSGLLSS